MERSFMIAVIAYLWMMISKVSEKESKLILNSVANQLSQVAIDDCGGNASDDICFLNGIINGIQRGDYHQLRHYIESSMQDAGSALDKIGSKLRYHLHSQHISQMLTNLDILVKDQNEKADQPETIKVVVNNCFGGFSVSTKALFEIYKRRGKKLYAYKDIRAKNGYKIVGKAFIPEEELDSIESAYDVHFYTSHVPQEMTDEERFEFNNEHYVSCYDIDRTDPDLIALLEEWGSERVSGSAANLGITEVPSDAKWHIEEYDGSEHVAENHRTW